MRRFAPLGYAIMLGLYKAILRDKKVCSEFYLYIYREIKIFIDKKHYTRKTRDI